MSRETIAENRRKKREIEALYSSRAALAPKFYKSLNNTTIKRPFDSSPKQSHWFLFHILLQLRVFLSLLLDLFDTVSNLIMLLKANKYKALALLLLAGAKTWAGNYKTSLDDLDEILLQPSPFKIILDGGSTGSRLHIFEFVQDDESGNEKCIRRGSSRADIPLSAFGRLPSDKERELNGTHVAEHLLPLFEYAATIIPSEFHETTQVQYAATAGMRLLDLDEQEAVYDALYEGLMESESFVFKSTRRQDIATLGGELEGFFGAVAANYLHGIVDTKLRVQSSENESDHSGPIGALDMGGSSTQIVFLPDRSCPTTMSPDDDKCQAETPDLHLNEDNFFSTSYLSYGVDQFRERFWSTLVRERQTEGDDEESCVNKSIQNPCANVGFTVEWEGFTLVGTGDTKECIRQTQRLIPHPELAHDNHEEIEMKVGGVENPPVKGKFLAMSLYFFSLDSLRVFSKPNDEAHKALNLAWPNPSIQELYDALDGLCSRDWDGDMALQVDTHSFTREEILPHRCIETVYMVTLLKDGFGFDLSSRDITFTFLVEGSEVEWTLGMALSMNAEEAALDSAKKENQSINKTFEETREKDGHDDAASSQSTWLLSSSLDVILSYFPSYSSK